MDIMRNGPTQIGTSRVVPLNTGRVRVSSRPRPLPKYYAMADGSPVPPQFLQDDFKKGLLDGSIREVPAPVVGPAPITEQVYEDDHAPVVQVTGELQNTESIIDSFAAKRAQAQKDFEEQLAILKEEEEAKLNAEAVPMEDSGTITAAEALEDLIWALENEGAYMVNSDTGQVIDLITLKWIGK